VVDCAVRVTIEIVNDLKNPGMANPFNRLSIGMLCLQAAPEESRMPSPSNVTLEAPQIISRGAHPHDRLLLFRCHIMAYLPYRHKGIQP